VHGLEREPGPETTAILRGVVGAHIPKSSDLYLAHLGTRQSTREGQGVADRAFSRALKRWL
jgi:hypothetical protein